MRLLLTKIDAEFSFSAIKIKIKYSLKMAN